MRIEDWSVVSDADPYTAPELIRPQLRGHVYGHPKFEDGHLVHTSYIKEVKDGKVITASGSEYELGVVDPDYEKLFPNARERVLKNIKL